MVFIFEKKKFDFGGQKPKISKIRDSHFVELVIFHLLVFVACDLLQNPIFQKHLNDGLNRGT